jgi:hypothetical protein
MKSMRSLWFLDETNHIKYRHGHSLGQIILTHYFIVRMIHLSGVPCLLVDCYLSKLSGWFVWVEHHVYLWTVVSVNSSSQDDLSKWMAMSIFDTINISWFWLNETTSLNDWSLGICEVSSKILLFVWFVQNRWMSWVIAIFFYFDNRPSTKISLFIIIRNKYFFKLPTLDNEQWNLWGASGS